MSGMKRVEAVVYGRVQGVSFRYYTQREAGRLRLTGWVRNRRDGTVETLAEGPEEALQAFVKFLHRGSPSARVDRVALSWGDATSEFNQFSVRAA
jgi:acylphosphatase